MADCREICAGLISAGVVSPAGEPPARDRAKAPGRKKQEEAPSVSAWAAAWMQRYGNAGDSRPMSGSWDAERYLSCLRCRYGAEATKVPNSILPQAPVAPTPAPTPPSSMRVAASAPAAVPAKTTSKEGTPPLRPSSTTAWTATAVIAGALAAAIRLLAMHRRASKETKGPTFASAEAPVPQTLIERAPLAAFETERLPAQPQPRPAAQPPEAPRVEPQPAAVASSPPKSRNSRSSTVSVSPTLSRKP